MDFPTALLRDLLQLSSSIGLDDDALGAPLASLVDGLQAAVPSYRGLDLTIVQNSHPVSLTAFIPAYDGDSIDTSLRVGFAALGQGFGSESRVVFYAARPGAFVDMAADFACALDTPTAIPDDPGRSANSSDGDEQRGPNRCDGQPPIVLDADLPPPTTMSGLVGLDGLSMVERAVGIMIDHGHHPDHAHATLRHDAAVAGVELHLYAARLLRPEPPPGIRQASFEASAVGAGRRDA